MENKKLSESKTTFHQVLYQKVCIIHRVMKNKTALIFLYHLLQKKKNRVKKYASQVSQGTQCDADEFDIATSFCISEENVHARTLTRMTMSASDSDSDEEARVFHSSLMYDKEEQEERLGRNTYGPSSSPQ